MLLLKSIFISAVFLFSIQSKAEFLSCDLKLGLIEDSDSSEIKQLFFEIEMNPLQSNIMIGTMNTLSCFGTTLESFKTETSKVTRENSGGIVHGTIRDSSVKIGSHHYRFKLEFAQTSRGSEYPNPTNLLTSGKIIPLDHENFIHQIVSGTCHFSPTSGGYLHFLRMSNYLANMKEKPVCH